MASIRPTVAIAPVHGVTMTPPISISYICQFATRHHPVRRFGRNYSRYERREDLSRPITGDTAHQRSVHLREPWRRMLSPSRRGQFVWPCRCSLAALDRVGRYRFASLSIEAVRLQARNLAVAAVRTPIPKQMNNHVLIAINHHRRPASTLSDSARMAAHPSC
jgi:hypothetical protein